jgi:peptide/nickel transport system ATP-binding protein
MYLGKMVEKCDAKELFKSQYHPYTKALISAIPRHKLGVKRDRIILKGEVTSPINPKPGCRFAPRCLYATDVCFQVEPLLEEITPSHFVACHHVREFNTI